MDHTIEKVAELIRLEFETYNQDVLQELIEQSPETTPSNVEIRFGAPYYLIAETKTENYLQGLIYSYLKHHNYNPKAPKSRKIFKNNIKNNINWDAEVGSSAGASVPGNDYI